MTLDTRSPQPEARTRCKHGMNPEWCAICNPPEGYDPSRRRNVISGRGVAPVRWDTRPMYDRTLRGGA
jgi:hypothetical protein